MPWPDPELTAEESLSLQAVMDVDVAAAATLLGTSRAQASALQRYVIMVCVLNHRRRRGIPHDDLYRQTKSLLRCMAPAMRNRLPEALRYGV